MEVELMEKGFTIDAATKITVIRIAECLLTPGDINLNWNDISNVLLQEGESVIACGSGTGKSRSTKACDNALSNYKTAYQTTKKSARLLFRLVGPKNLLLKEVNDAREMIEKSVYSTSGVVFGVARDDSLNDEVRITIMAT
jgi:cell division protein FtsZ